MKDRVAGRFTTPHRLHKPYPSICIPVYVSNEDQYEKCNKIIFVIGIVAIVAASVLLWWACGDDIKLILGD